MSLLKNKNGQSSALLPSTGLVCGIYARKSQDDSSRNDENRSTTRQVEHAKAFAKSRGWQVSEAHIYVDEGVSGGEFQNRPGFARLIADLPARGKPPFSILLMSEPSRLGRDQQRNGFYLAHIRDSGVKIFYYLDGTEELLDTPEHVLMSSVRSYAAEVERLKAGQRSRDALRRRAERGFNAGGIVLGYRNVVVHHINGDGERVKSHTDYKIDRTQADTIRRIFRMYADGWGFTSIAKCMNGDSRYLNENRKYFGGQTPKPPRKGTGSWAPSSVRELLNNVRYTGKVPWGEFQKVYRHGTKQRIKVGPPMYANRPDLRIVPKDLWNRVQKRLSAMRETYGRTQAKGAKRDLGRVSPYFLSGIARCGGCGAAMIATRVALGSAKKRELVPHYMCGWNNKRGGTVCSNNTRKRVDELDEKVRRAIEQSLLRPEAVDLERNLRLVEVERRKEPDKAKHLEAQKARLIRERDNLLAMRAHGELPASVLTEITAREQAIADVETQLDQLPPKEFDIKEIGSLKTSMLERMAEFRKLLRAEVSLAREALRKLLGDKPIRCVPIKVNGRKDFGIRGETQLGALLTSAPRINIRIKDQKAAKPAIARLASPRGFEPRLPP